MCGCEIASKEEIKARIKAIEEGTYESGLTIEVIRNKVEETTNIIMGRVKNDVTNT